MSSGKEVWLGYGYGTVVHETANYVVAAGRMNGMPAFYVVRRDEQPVEPGTFRRYYLDTTDALADIKRLAGEDVAPLPETMRQYYANPDFDPR